MRGAVVGVAVVCAVMAASVPRVDGLYSSFYAPLFEPRVLGYRVDMPFRPEGAREARGRYRERWGDRGGGLIARLGEGGAQSYEGGDHENRYGDVKFYYTYSNNYKK